MKIIRCNNCYNIYEEEEINIYKTLCLKVSEFEKINDITNNDFNGLLTHAKTVYFLIDFYLKNKPKKKKEEKIKSVLPYDPTIFLSQQ
jgi:hypothetical protein